MPVDDDYSATFCTAGGLHLPSATELCGWYSRIDRFHSPVAGVSSHFASLPAPGLALWKYRSSDPSELKVKGIQSARFCRCSEFGTGNPSPSYSVIDQNASTGGMSDLSKCNV